MDAEPFTAIAARTLPRPLRSALAVTGAVFVLPMILLATLSAKFSLAGAVATGSMMGLLIAPLAFVAAYLLPRLKEAQAPLRMNGDVLEHGAVPIARRGAIDEGHAWEASDGAHVQLGKKIHLRLARIEDARALLEEMEVDASKKAARFTIVAPSKGNKRIRTAAMLLSVPLSVAVAVGLQKLTGHFTPGIVFLLPLILAAVAAMIPASIRIGADGVLLTWLWQRRFIPLADIEDVTITVHPAFNSVALGLRITLRGGEEVFVNVANPRDTKEARALGSASLQTILERIEEAREVARGGGGVDAARALGRDGRTGGAWLASLRAAFGGAEDFRGGRPLTIEQLWRAVEDPDARPWVRAAAAAALATQEGPEVRARIRVTAEATVAPKLRVAFDAAADADDARLAEALEAIDEDDPREARRA